MADVIRSFLVFIILVFLPGSSPTLFPVGRVSICPGEMRMFTCHVSMATTSPQVYWLIQFEAPGLSDVQQTYISEDQLGDVVTDNREEYTFTFNFTSKSALNLVSTLTVTLNAHDQTSFNTATVDCNQANESATLHITTDLPSPPMDLKQIGIQGMHSSQRVILQWNASEAADYYIITVSPSVNAPGSSFKFVAPNTTIEIPVLYNQEYNISVVANNCVGNSTPSGVTISIVPSDCGSSIEELMFVSGWISDRCSTGEGSSINVKCSDGLSSTFTLASVCSSEGIWKQEFTSTSVTRAQWPSKSTESGTLSQSSFSPIYILPIASALNFVLGLLIGIILTVCIIKLQARRKALSSAAAASATQDQKHMPIQMPVYEELGIHSTIQAADLERISLGCKVMDNVAYGPMCN